MHGDDEGEKTTDSPLQTKTVLARFSSAAPGAASASAVGIAITGRMVAVSAMRTVENCILEDRREDDEIVRENRIL